MGFWLLALSNVLIYSYYDYENDKQQQVQTLAVRAGRKTCAWLCLLFLLMALVIFVMLGFTGGIHHRFTTLGVIMAVTLMHILFFGKYYARTGNYGLIADLVFLMPLVLKVF